MECREPSDLVGGMAPRTLSKRSLTDQWLALLSNSSQIGGRMPARFCPHEFGSWPGSTTRFPPERIPSALRLGDDERVIKIREQMVSVRKLAFHRFEGLMLTHCNFSGISGSPRSPPSPCGRVCTTPWESSPVLRRRATKHSDKRNCLTSSTLINPCIKVARSSASVKPWRMCAMHSQPAFVDNAYWCGEVAASTAFLNCWAMVRATNLPTTSPVTIPRTPPSGLDGHPAQLHHFADFGISPRANFSATLEEHVQCAHVAAQAQVFCRHPRRTNRRTTPCRPQVAGQ